MFWVLFIVGALLSTWKKAGDREIIYPMKIQNIIFDFGNVLITFDPMSFLQKYFKETSVQEELYELIFKSWEWVNLDRGSLTVEKAKQIFIRRKPHLTSQIKIVFNFWLKMFQPIPEAVILAEELRTQGYTLFVLSNCIRESYEYIRRHATFLDRFQGIVVSCDLGFIKPEKEIYEYLLYKYLLNPQDCLFIDDMEANVAGAIAVGIPAIRFDSLERLRLELHELGIL